MLELLSPFVVATSPRGMRTFPRWSLHLLRKTTTLISFPGSACESCQMILWNKSRQNRKNYHKESQENCLDFHSYKKKKKRAVIFCKAVLSRAGIHWNSVAWRCWLREGVKYIEKYIGVCRYVDRCAYFPWNGASPNFRNCSIPYRCHWGWML